jgi:signal transduction histidine kinase
MLRPAEPELDPAGSLYAVAQRGLLEVTETPASVVPAGIVELVAAGSATPVEPQEVADLLGCKTPQSAAGAPMWAGERLQGVLLFLWPDVNPSAPIDLLQATTFGERVALAMAVAEAQADRERIAVLEDRDRIARDLHDLVIQRLFAVGLSVQGAARDVIKPTVATRLERVVDDLDETIKDVRRTIYQLHAGPAGAGGLRSEIDEVLEHAEDALGFAPSLRTDGPLSAVPDEVGADLIAVLRESLTNAAKHADATAVQVEVRVGSALEASVTDNGTGMPASLSRRSGLSNLQARAEAHGGSLTISPAQGGGTEVVWWVPLTSTARD